MQYRLCVVVGTLLACGSTNEAFEDAGPDAYGHKNFDATDGIADHSSPFGESSVPEAAPPTACGEVDASSFTPTWQGSWVSPNAFGGSACTDNQIYDYITQCMFANVTDPSACASKVGQPNSLDCFTCLTPSKTSEGPFRAVAETCGLPQAYNIGGCIANALGTTCASAWMTAHECEQIACSTCTCMGGEDGWDSYHPCLGDHNNPTCDTARANAACALSSTSPIVKTCLAVVDPSTSNNAGFDFAKLFCGGTPPSDAGTD